MQFDDIEECSICTEVYTDPRVLPCGHTYCLKCIEALSKDKQPGDKLACPLCREEFTVPSNGVGNLPKTAVSAASTGGQTVFRCLFIYTRWPKKLAQCLYALTMPNINRFSKLYLHILLPVPSDDITDGIWHLVSVF